MEQCLFASRDKTREKSFFWGEGVQIWVKQTKIGSKIRFFAFFSSLVHQFSFKLHRIIASNNVSLLVEVKPVKKTEGPNLRQMGQNRAQN